MEVNGAPGCEGPSADAIVLDVRTLTRSAAKESRYREGAHAFREGRPPPRARYPITDDTPTFAFSSSEAGSTFECSLDDAAFAACTSPHTSQVLGNGSHTFSVRAIDAAGNVDSSPAASSFTVDVPTISIGDVRLREGKKGTTKTFSFAVTVSKVSTESVTVAWTTANGSAVAPGDYTAASGTLTFLPGETSETINVLVNGDKTKEGDETFYVNLSVPISATIADIQGVGIIVNDD